MKKIFSAIAALMLAAPSFAQYSSGGFELDSENIYYGIRLGMNMATLTGDVENTGTRVGLNFAPVVGIRVSESTPIFLDATSSCHPSSVGST